MKTKIIVVDDNYELRFYVKKGLSQVSKDYENIEAENGHHCLDILENNDLPDIILLDIMMPELNGWQVFKLIKENEKWKKIPIAFLTAKSDPFSTGLGKILGNSYIEKPFKIEDLDKKIKLIIKNSSEINLTKEKIIDDMIKKTIK